MNICIRIAGEAGQGVQHTGNLLLSTFAGMGLHTLATQSYMSRIRGGLNWYDIRISDRPLYAGTHDADLLVTFTPEAVTLLGGHLKPGGLVLHDDDQAEDATAIPFTRIAKEAAGSALYANTVAAGAVFAMLGYPVDSLCEHLRHAFARKDATAVDGNLACARRGHDEALRHGLHLAAPAPANAPSSLYSGAGAIGLGAATAGVKFAAAYPMTPGTAVFQWLAEHADQYGILVEQAEDEIAAYNMICGATYAGVPALTSTSGGGFALMAEGVSLAGMMELPTLAVIAQRPGPATGMPTRTAQGDLLFVLHAGHGEFPRALFAPGTVEQCHALTRHALQIAHRYQVPTFVLTDQYLQDLQTNTGPLPVQPAPIDRCLAANPGPNYVRYALTPDGVSPRAIPGGAALVVCDSDEHTPDGHLTEDFAAHIAQDDKRMAKLTGLTQAALPPEFHGDRNADLLLVCWGSSYGPCREAVDTLAARGRPAAMLHFSQVWPLRREDIAPHLGRHKRIVVVEGNHTGQFASSLRERGLLASCESLLRYDGLPFDAEFIVERIGP